PANQCTTGSIQCCNSLEPASGDSTVVEKLLSGLGIVIDDIEALVGITCTPISILGLGQGSCSEQPVCCDNDSFNGIIAIGCVPININL
ncbi:hydrophobin, partial [Gymnopilus junonius]